MNDPRKAIRAALMIARRPAAYGGFQDGFGGGVLPTEHAMMSNLVPVMHPDGPQYIPEDEFNEQLQAQQEGRPNILTGGGTFARGGEVERRAMDPRDLPGIHVKTRHTFADGGTPPGIGGGTFAGPKYPDVQRLANAHDKFIYHSGVIDDYDQMKHYLEPQHGGWIQELANHVGDVEPEEILDRATPLVWFSDTPSWVAMKVARKLQKPVSDVTEDEIRQHGHLALVPRKGDHAEHIYRIGNEGLSNGPYSNVTTLSGESKKAYHTDLYNDGKEPFGVERNEYVSARDVEPLLHLTGDHLVDFLKAVEQKKAGSIATRAAGGPVEEEEGFDAYHGSPYAFERFDSSKIGAGEGNQAFGYGHYLAEAEPVARGYRNSVSRQKGNVNLLDKSGAVIPVTEYAKPHLDSFFQSFGSDLRKSDIDHQISLLRTNWIPGQEKTANEYADAAETATDPGSREFFLNELEKIRKTKQGYVDLADALEKTHRVEPVGHMYHVRVKAKPEHFLDWHAPLSEQHPEVRKKLATLGFTYDDAKASVADDALLAALFDKGPQQLPQHPPNPTGEDIHYNLMRGSNKAAAAAKLREAGIPGIKYFDAGSRSAGQGTRNYVIFDPDMIEVKRRYAEGGEVPSSKSLFTQDVYHGTSDNFPAFRDQPGGYSMPRALGVHVARDPVISSNPYFVERNIDGKGGNVMPLKTFSDDRFYEVHQPLHSYLPEGTEKAPGTVRTDDVAVENEIMSHAFKRDKGLLKRTLMQQRNLPENEAHEAAEKLHAGQPWEHLGQPVKDIDHLVRNYGLRPWSEEDRAWAVNSFRDALRQRGYVGVKYINTSPGETEGATDPTCYIVFPKKGQEGVYPLRGRFAKYDPARAHEPDLMSARGGAVQRADGGNVPPRDFSDDGNVQQALSLSKRVTEGRTPQLQDAADLVAAGRMGPEEYHALVGTHKPVRPYTEVPRMATTEDLFYGLSSDKHAKIGAEKNIPEGHPVGLRLDIPAYQNKNVWAPTIHEGHSHDSKAIAHAPFAHIDSPTFSVHEDKALGVARGRAKAPFAKINGFWKPTSAEDAQAMAQEYLNHLEWRQVGMDPERHSFFYDRENRQPIVSADEALQVGPLVLAKNPKYGDIRDFKYASGGMVDDDPTVQQALDLTRQAQPQQEPVASAMQVAQSVVAPGRRRFEIAPARGFTAAPITKNEPTLTEPGSVSIKSLSSAFKRAIDNHLALSPAEQIANARQAENNVAKFVGRGQTGKINSVLTANKKLMKAQTAGEDDTPLTLPDGRTVETIGLSLMPDYREGQFRVCGNSDACRDLCLGKESGQYRYDPTATQAEIPTTKEQLEQAKNKPRMAALRRTAAMLRDPESFAVYLHELIDGAKIIKTKDGAGAPERAVRPASVDHGADHQGAPDGVVLRLHQDELRPGGAEPSLHVLVHRPASARA